MGAYKYLEEIWKRKQSDVMRFIMRMRTWEYRQLPTMHKCRRPSRPDKARKLGYKRKQGFAIWRIRIRRGGRKKMLPKGIVYGKPVHQGVNAMPKARSLRAVAEERIGRKCGNLRLLNSYWVAQDATYKYFEAILLDPSHNAVRNDARYNWICNPNEKHRESRGLTSAGKAHRGLRKKGHRAKKARPSVHSNWKRRNQIKLHRFRWAACWTSLLIISELIRKKTLRGRDRPGYFPSSSAALILLLYGSQPWTLSFVAPLEQEVQPRCKLPSHQPLRGHL